MAKHKEYALQIFTENLSTGHMDWFWITKTGVGTEHNAEWRSTPREADSLSPLMQGYKLRVVEREASAD